jgi:hypothetical protein
LKKEWGSRFSLTAAYREKESGERREKDPVAIFEKAAFQAGGKNHEFFTSAARVYILKGEEDARCAAVAAAGMATRNQRKAMVKELEKIASNVLQSYPDKKQRKVLADRVLALQRIKRILSFAKAINSPSPQRSHSHSFWTKVGQCSWMSF